MRKNNWYFFLFFREGVKTKQIVPNVSQDLLRVLIQCITLDKLAPILLQNLPFLCELDKLTWLFYFGYSSIVMEAISFVTVLKLKKTKEPNATVNSEL